MLPLLGTWSAPEAWASVLFITRLGSDIGPPLPHSFEHRDHPQYVIGGDYTKVRSEDPWDSLGIVIGIIFTRNCSFKQIFKC